MEITTVDHGVYEQTLVVRTELRSDGVSATKTLYHRLLLVETNHYISTHSCTLAVSPELPSAFEYFYITRGLILSDGLLWRSTSKIHNSGEPLRELQSSLKPTSLLYGSGLVRYVYVLAADVTGQSAQQIEVSAVRKVVVYRCGRGANKSVDHIPVVLRHSAEEGGTESTTEGSTSESISAASPSTDTASVPAPGVDAVSNGTDDGQMSLTPAPASVTALSPSLLSHNGISLHSFEGTVHVHPMDSPYPTIKLDGSHGLVIAQNFLTVSDARLKENIQHLPDMRASLDKIATYVFRYRHGAKSTSDKPTLSEADEAKRPLTTHIGLLAQEVQEHFPGIVYAQDDGTLAVDYVQLVPVLIQSVQDLMRNVKELQHDTGSNCVNTTAVLSETQLMLHIRCRNVMAIQQHLRDGGSADQIVCHVNNWTLLHYSVVHQALDIIAVLLQAGASQYAVDIRTMTPLQLAIRLKAKQCAEMLIRWDCFGIGNI